MNLDEAYDKAEVAGYEGDAQGHAGRTRAGVQSTIPSHISCVRGRFCARFYVAESLSCFDVLAEGNIGAVPVSSKSCFHSSFAVTETHLLIFQEKASSKTAQPRDARSV